MSRFALFGGSSGDSTPTTYNDDPGLVTGDWAQGRAWGASASSAEAQARATSDEQAVAVDVETRAAWGIYYQDLLAGRR